MRFICRTYEGQVTALEQDDKKAVIAKKNKIRRKML